MIRRTFLLAVLAAVISVAQASAQAVTVRAGEHDGFTRLAIDLPQRLAYEIKGERELLIEIDALSATFETSAVLPRLNAGRVLGAASIGQGQLKVDLACACRVETFYAERSMLVLDIFGEPEALAPPPAVEPAEASEPAPRVRLPIVLDEGVNTFLPKRSVAQAKPEAERLPQETDSAIGSAKLRAEAKSKLLEQVARGAAQGLLKPKSLPKPRSAAPTLDLSQDRPEPPIESASARQAPINLKAITSADRDFFAVQNAPLNGQNGMPCMSDDQLAVLSWSSDGDFSASVGVLRAELYGEFDKPDAQAAVALAKFYIAAGFGVEAGQALREIALDPAETYLLALADLVEDGATRAPLPATWQIGCDTAAALWAYLGGDRPTSNKPLNTGALEAAFSALPRALRTHLGPILIERLREDGYSDTAEALLHFTKRGLSDTAPSVTMAEAGLKLAESGHGGAKADFQKVIEANGVDAPEALIALADATFEEGEALDARYIGLAEAFHLEYRKDEKGAEFARILAKAYAANGQFQDAVAQMAAVLPLLDERAREETSNFVMEHLAQQADDLTFLEFAYDARIEGLRLGSAQEHMAAKRLIGLGFPDQALVFLSTAARGQEGRERKLLRAEAAILMNRPRQAEAELLGLHGVDVEALRVAAKVEQEDHRGARIALQTQGAENAAAEQAWFASEWDVLRELGAESWAAEQELVAAPGAQARETKPIASGEALLEESQSLRELVGVVLGRHELVQAGPTEKTDP